MVKDTALVMWAQTVTKPGHKWVIKDVVKDKALVMWAQTVNKSGHNYGHKNFDDLI